MGSFLQKQIYKRKDVNYVVIYIQFIVVSTLYRIFPFYLATFLLSFINLPFD